MPETLKLSPGGRRYGALLDQPDPRDLTFAVSNVNRLMQAARAVDLREFLPATWDQGHLGRCTGEAYRAQRVFLYRRYFKYERYKPVDPADFDVSANYIYYREREKEGTLPEDSGAQMRTGCYVLNHFGACLDKSYPSGDKVYNDAPDAEVTAEAYQLKGGAYHRLQSFEEMKTCLSSAFPFVFALGMAVFQSFELIGVDGRMPVPDVESEMLMGGHAVCVCGYNDDFENIDGSAGAFLVRNSWGSDWGDNGHFHMPYSVAASDVIQDAWILHLGKAWK